MQAIILAGGFGTRLRSVLTDVPKPMAPIQGKPFLAYLLDYLKTQGISKVILSVHYLREQIENYFKTAYLGMTIQYAVEEEPLGTGGAMVNALRQLDSPEPVFVLNGDTFLKLNYRAMWAAHQKTSPLITMALRKVEDCGRYGTALLEGNHVVAFENQGSHGPGLINAGVYLIDPQLFTAFGDTLQMSFSFEKDFLLPMIKQLRPQAFVVDDYFIDIGIPEDYARAQQDFV